MENGIILGYQDVTVGNTTVSSPIYSEDVIVIGSGENQRIISIKQHEEEEAVKIAEVEARNQAIIDFQNLNN
jgi:hypothetical protein